TGRALLKLLIKPQHARVQRAFGETLVRPIGKQRVINIAKYFELPGRLTSLGLREMAAHAVGAFALSRSTAARANKLVANACFAFSAVSALLRALYLVRVWCHANGNLGADSGHSSNSSNSYCRRSGAICCLQPKCSVGPACAGCLHCHC